MAFNITDRSNGCQRKIDDEFLLVPDVSSGTIGHVALLRVFHRGDITSPLLHDQARSGATGPGVTEQSSVTRGEEQVASKEKVVSR
jgi:hypothetical protein